MKINFKIFFSVGLLFEVMISFKLAIILSINDVFTSRQSYIAHEIIEDQESVTCRQNVCDHSPAKNESNCSGWERGVEESITGAAKVLKRFPGPTFDIGETVITSYKTYTDELGSLTKCNSTFLSIRCTSTLEVLSLLAKLGKTPTYLLYQFGKVLPKVSSEFRSIVRNLSGSIGALVEEVNEVITAVERSINRILKQFQNRFVERQHERCEKIDFEECIKCAQMLTNTVALIAETALNDCDCVTYANEAYEAIAALTFILNFYLTGVQGTVYGIRKHFPVSQ